MAINDPLRKVLWHCPSKCLQDLGWWLSFLAALKTCPTFARRQLPPRSPSNTEINGQVHSSAAQCSKQVTPGTLTWPIGFEPKERSHAVCLQCHLFYLNAQCPCRLFSSLPQITGFIPSGDILLPEAFKLIFYYQCKCVLSNLPTAQ